MVSSAFHCALRLVPAAVAVFALCATAYPLQVARQQKDKGVAEVLGESFKLAGKVASAQCPDSLLLSKKSPLADSEISKLLDKLKDSDSENPLLASVERFFDIVRYEDISLSGDKCSGEGEVVLVSPSVLGFLSSSTSLLAGLGVDLDGLVKAASSVAGLTKKHGVAVGFDQSPGQCTKGSSMKLPSALAWINDLEGAVPTIAKEAGIKKAKKGDVYLVTVADIPESADDVLNAKEPLCIFNSASSNSSSSASTPTVSPSPSKKKEGTKVCFPAHAQVLLESGDVVRMDQISIGDRVQVGPGQYSPVFMFTHKLASIVHPFVTVDTASGARLSLTEGHYLYANGALIPASQLSVGASVTLASGAVDRVTAISTENAEGLYNPQTVTGDIVVDGVLTSTYTTAIHPAVAHALLTPFRLMQGLGWHCSAFESGSGALPVHALRGGAPL